MKLSYLNKWLLTFKTQPTKPTRSNRRERLADLFRSIDESSARKAKERTARNAAVPGISTPRASQFAQPTRTYYGVKLTTVIVTGAFCAAAAALTAAVIVKRKNIITPGIDTRLDAVASSIRKHRNAKDYAGFNNLPPAVQASSPISEQAFVVTGMKPDGCIEFAVMSTNIAPIGADKKITVESMTHCLEEPSLPTTIKEVLPMSYLIAGPKQ